MREKYKIGILKSMNVSRLYISVLKVWALISPFDFIISASLTYLRGSSKENYSLAMIINKESSRDLFRPLKMESICSNSITLTPGSKEKESKHNLRYLFLWKSDNIRKTL